MSEILAPAGSMESVYAAVRCGADAVYLAGGTFNARKNAKNFTDDELAAAVEYCHIHGVKVYHALNILVKDCELCAVKSEIKRILARNEDALILQDLGIAGIAKDICPEIPLHASTQMSIYTPDGVEYLERFGFKRIVLSREMSREEIAEVRKSTKAELEVFVHGALCMSVSGQCYMSSVFGGRSGNRGLCAQPCRLDFKAAGGTGKDLSLKDNSLIDYLAEMEALGIDSFKIEGRMKRPEYVAAAVTSCRSALNGNPAPLQRKKLKSIFSRQGFTDGYYVSDLGKNMFGSRSYEDVTAASSGLMKEISQLYHKEKQTIPCSLKAYIKKDKKPRLEMSVKGEHFTAESDLIPEPAVNFPLDAQRVNKRISKLGGTPFYAVSADTEIDAGIMVPAGKINELRRLAVAGIERKLCKAKNYVFRDKEFLFPEHVCGRKPELYARFMNENQITSAETFDKIIVPMFSSDEVFQSFKNCVAEIPRGIFGKEEIVRTRLSHLRELGVTKVACGNFGAAATAKKAGFKIIGLIGWNAMNSATAYFSDADEILMSFELSLKDIEKIQTNKKIGAMVYGYFPLMLTRNCPVKNGKTCRECGNSSYITDRKGEKLQVRCTLGCSEIFNAVPLYFADKISDIKNTDFHLMYFTTESKEEIEEILKKYKNHDKPGFRFTRGLYYKGVE